MLFTNSAQYQGRQACHYCGFCGSYGCEVEAKSSTPQELAKLLKENYDLWGPIAKKIGFTIDS